jgi:hypothetical protein
MKKFLTYVTVLLTITWTILHCFFVNAALSQCSTYALVGITNIESGIIFYFNESCGRRGRVGSILRDPGRNLGHGIVTANAHSPSISAQANTSSNFPH